MRPRYSRSAASLNNKEKSYNMETRQITTTVIEAAEGKLLRRRSDKTVYGKTVYLGYNYYESGGRIEPRQDAPEENETDVQP